MGFIAEPAPQLATRLERDFRISSKYRLGVGSLLQKAAVNLEAIRLLKQIEQDGRPASENEKGILVRYTGWGALPQVFHPRVPEEWRSAASELEARLAWHTAGRIPDRLRTAHCSRTRSKNEFGSETDSKAASRIVESG